MKNYFKGIYPEFVILLPNLKNRISRSEELWGLKVITVPKPWLGKSQKYLYRQYMF